MHYVCIIMGYIEVVTDDVDNPYLKSQNHGTGL